jgi:hypothetical protein
MIKIINQISNEKICIKLNFIIMSKSITQLERIQLLFEHLKIEPVTINNLIELLKQKNIVCSSRQLYRDLECIKKYYLRPNEQLSIAVSEHNRKTYRIVLESEELDLTKRDIAAFQLTRSASPKYLMTNRGDSMLKFRTVYNSFIKKNSAFYAFMQDHQNTRSNFYEVEHDKNYDDKIDAVIWCIANFKKLWIENLEGDATSISRKTNDKFLFKCMKLIFHRGNHFVAGFSLPNDKFMIIDISKITSYEITDKSFIHKELSKLTEEHILKRFGVTQNIDDKSYDIILEISSVTGEFMKQYHWHPTQEFIKLPSGNWQLKLHCGINRELVGWIFMWMTNIKISKPLVLKNLFNKQLEEMKSIYANDKSLKYNNLFK